MSSEGRLRAGVREFFRHVPVAKSITFGLLDAWFQVWLLPFRRFRRHGATTENQALLDRADEYNRAAEDYFANFQNPSFLLNKPFSDPAGLPKHLMDVGILIAAGKIAPGDVVAEIGAGSCWLSHMLNRYGCPTISIDVSPTALDLGKRLFETDPFTNWNMNPRFAPYDGHRLPLDAGSCDRIVISDAFHHIPNQRELLTEMHRALRPDGIVAMSEPGAGHGDAEHSLKEARDWGVLENELVVEDLAALARDCGFDEVRVVIQSPLIETEIEARHFRSFMGGKGFARYWNHLCRALEQHHYIVCYKSAPVATTRRPKRLRARIDGVDGARTEVAAGAPLRLELRIINEGDTVWLGGAMPRGGWTRLGAHLERDNDAREVVNFDWWRAPFPGDVAPGAEVRVRAELPAIAEPGRYRVVIEPVIEGMCWFFERESDPLVLAITVIA
jgi:SAM-dependent methyltransferase